MCISSSPPIDVHSMRAFESWPKDSEKERGKRKCQIRVEIGTKRNRGGMTKNKEKGKRKT